MPIFSASIDDKALNERIERMRNNSFKLAREALESLAIKMQARIKQQKLSGQVLKRVSGDLSRSVNYRLEIADKGLTAIVGANTPYAARQEYGFHGVESVRSFVRRSKGQMAKARRNKLGLETRPSKAKNIGTGDTVVRAHTRRANTPERSYLRSSLDDMRSEIQKTMQEAILKGLK